VAGETPRIAEATEVARRVENSVEGFIVESVIVCVRRAESGAARRAAEGAVEARRRGSQSIAPKGGKRQAD
jgi:hypothetical protein